MMLNGVIMLVGFACRLHSSLRLLMLINMYILIKMPRNLSGVVGHIATLNTHILKGLPAKSFVDLSQKKK